MCEDISDNNRNFEIKTLRAMNGKLHSCGEYWFLNAPIVYDYIEKSCGPVNKHCRQNGFYFKITGTFWNTDVFEITIVEPKCANDT